MAQQAKDALIARFDYYASESHELTVLQGDHLTLLDDSSPWWKVQNANGEVGYVPSNYVRPVRQNLFTNLKNSLGRRKGSTGSKTAPSYSNYSGQLSPEPVNNIGAGSPNRRFAASPGNGPLGGGRLPTLNPADANQAHQNNYYRGSQNEGSHIYHTTTPKLKPVGEMNTGYRDGHTQPKIGQKYQTSDAKRTTMLPTMNDNVTSPTSTDLIYRVIASYSPQRSDELQINPGDRIRVLEKSADGWWFGELLLTGQVNPRGWFPSNYVVVDNTNGSNHYGTLRNFRTPDNRAVSVIPAFAPSNTNQAPQPKLAAITLYPFVRNHLEELSFNVNEVLEVLEQPPENAEWLRCRNARGDVGWVPSSHLKLVNPSMTAASKKLSNTHSPSGAVPSSPRTKGPNLSSNLKYFDPYPDQSAESIAESVIDGEAVRLTHALKSRNSGAHLRKPWFWGAINQAECEYMLRQYSHPGDFIIRDSTSTPNDLTIVLNSGNVIRNFRITVRNGCYHIGMRVFPSIEELIFHFQRHYIFTSKFESCFLVRPFAHPGFLQSPWYAMNQQLVPPVYTPVFRPYEAVCGTQPNVTRNLSR